MIITGLFIRGYGKLKDREILPGPGMNIIYGENEAGKTTVQSFIKAMLYGISPSRAGRENLPESKRYMPWDGGAYGGALTCRKDNGETIRIEADFSGKVFKVYNEALQDITGTFPYYKREGLKVGEVLFEMDRDCFENTAFIRQSHTVLQEQEMGYVYEKITNLSQTGLESTSVGKARKALSEAEKSLGNNKTVDRPYNILRETLETAEAKYREASGKRKRMMGQMERKKQLLPLIEELGQQMEIDRINRQARFLFQEKRTLENIRMRYLEIEEDIQHLDETVSRLRKRKEELGGVEGIGETDLLECIRKASAAKEKEQALEGTDHQKEIEKRIARNKRIRWASLLACVLLFAGGVSLLPFHVPAGVASLALGAGWSAITVVLWKGQKKDRELSRLLAEKQELDRLREEQETLNALFLSCGENRVRNFMEAEIKLSKLFEKKRYLEKTNGEMEAEEKRKKQLREIQESILKEAGLKTFQDLDARMAENGKALKKAGAGETEIDDREIEATRKIFEEKNREMAGITALLQEYWSEDEDLVLIQETIDGCRMKLEILERTKQSLQEASETIVQASVRLREDIIPVLNRNMGIILGKVTGEKYRRISADQEGKLRMEHGNIVRSAQEFSDGTVDQMYFSLRMAASDLFSKKETLPLLIDEGFAFYDEKRAGNTLHFLHEISQTRQIILFTCKETELNRFKAFSDVHFELL